MKTVKLTQLCNIKGGIPAPKQTGAMGNVPFIRMRELGDSHLSSTFSPGQEYLTEKDEKIFATKFIEPGAVLLPRSGSVHLNHRAHLETKAAIVSHIGALIPNKETNSLFLYYLMTGYDMTEIMTQTTGLNMIKFGQLAEVEFQIPDTLLEQAKIAKILSIVDRAIEQTEALIAKQQRIKTGLMQDLFTYGIDERGNLRSEETHEFKDFLAGNSLLERISVEWTPTQIGNVVTLQRGHDITENELLDGPYPVVSSSGVIGYHSHFTSKGPNVVVGRKGTIGKVHYLEHDFWAHDTSLYVTNFRGNNERYIYYLFNYLDLARYGTKSGSPSLNRNDIHPLWIGLPSPDEQNQIITILMGCDYRLDSLNGVLGKLRSLKTGLMQDLLTGKKRVTALLTDNGKVNL